MSQEYAEYNLIAAVDHEGTQWGSGHYVAVCNKHTPTYPIWTEFNDTQLYSCDDNRIPHPMNAYLLFYVKKQGQ